MKAPRPLKVLKFGGTSVGTAERLQDVLAIVRAAARTHHVVVTASALAGVTDELVRSWTAGDRAGATHTLRDRHRGMAEQLLGPEARAAYEQSADALLARALAPPDVPEGSPAHRDGWLALGERLSVPLVSAFFSEHGIPSAPVDAASLIRTDDGHGAAEVDVEITGSQVRAWRERLDPAVTPVVTGFIGATAQGVTTTLGRGGSDYTAALLASALGASVLERWTDVDGIYTDDPRRNAHAHRLAYVVLEEAWAWNHAGRLGMHRKALDPLVQAGIPVHVRSTAQPDGEGTLILPAQNKHVRAAAG